MRNRRLKKAIVELNFFQSNITDEQTIRRQRYATRIYIILYVLTVFGIGLFAAFSPQLINDVIYFPTNLQFNKLMRKYSTTIQCLCSKIERGDIVGQCVERSIEMAIGIMAILFSGASYLPLSPHEPFERLQLLTDLTRPRCVLTHSTTDHLIPKNKVSVENIIKGDFESSTDVNVLMDDIAFLIFTSGSTGTPKVVPISHRNFTYMVHSHNQLLSNRENDVIIQMGSCSFDEHVDEYLGSYICGATLVLLRPHGNLDTYYLCQTIVKNQITMIDFVPTSLSVLSDYLNRNGDPEISNCLATLKLITVGGEQLQRKAASSLFRYLPKSCCLANIYAPAECTISALAYRMQATDSIIPEIVPIGRCLPGRKVLVLDNYGQQVLPDGRHIGEIFLGGVGIFSGYLDDPQASERVLVQIPNVDGVFYRTGDLARITSDGQLVFVGRKDFQVKLRGQRIELGEIETVIMLYSLDITNCVVVKVTHENLEHIVAYVETKIHLNTNILRDECSKHLPLYMVPSLFVLVDNFPLNLNGKLDRKALPCPDFSLLSSDMTESDEQHRSDLERHIASIWCRVLGLKHIPTINISFFKLGGHSLLLMKLHHNYQTQFRQSIDISLLFRSTTIADHARLIEERQVILHLPWIPLNIIEGPASYAQTSIWLAEHTRFIDWPQLAPVFNMNMIFQIDAGQLSIDRCLQALNSVVSKHWIFRTRLMFDVKHGILRQSIHNAITYPMRVSTVHDEQQQKKILREEMWTPFDTENNGVFRCHFIRYDHGDNKDILLTNDLLLFNFHHGSFDGQAIDLFLDELKLAYAGEELQTPCLQYIDYSVHERTLLMSEACTYWKELLCDYAWDRQLNLGSTKQSLSARRTGQGELLSITIPLEIARSMVMCANELNVTLFQLGLTCYYLFLAQLSAHNRDACVGVIHQNRYRPELVSMIGMFVNILPCRIVNADLDKLSFIELVYKVQKAFLTSVQHAHLPYDKLIDLHRVPNSHLQFPYLQTIFSVDTTLIDYTNMDDIMFGDSCRISTYKKPIKDIDVGYKFDLDVSFSFDKHAMTIDCVWGYMSDVFERETIEQHANSLVKLLTQLFGSNRTDQLHLPLNEIITLNTNETNETNQEVSIPCSIPIIDISQQQTELMKSIQVVFSRILDCTTDDIDVNKSFFEQGGTSLKALQLITLLQREISTEINTHLFFDHLSVIQLARAITNLRTHSVLSRKETVFGC
ncbi:unnamed protein product [Adineta ricciae]|uniref:Carrier domain-containing protein n=1 Tax=Adineta ricciae TaxID=249248 RepID=A0A815BI51_ADIRI|nr:unnamed protein product [Adineta ricciae]